MGGQELNLEKSILLVKKSTVPEMPSTEIGIFDRSSPGSFSLPFLAGAWLVYEPVSNIVLLDRSGIQDEVAAIIGGMALAAVSNAHKLIWEACKSEQSYNWKRKAGAAGGGVVGLGAVGGVLSVVDIGLTGGMGTLATLLILASGTGVGAAAGDATARVSSQKLCPNGHPGKCCEKICMKCGFLFRVVPTWGGVTTQADAVRVHGPRIDWYDFVSIMQGRGLNFVEASAVYEQNFQEFDIDTFDRGEIPTMGRDSFFHWLEKEEAQLANFFGERPSKDFWNAAEQTVRSMCEPKKPISIEAIQTHRAPR